MTTAERDVETAREALKAARDALDADLVFKASVIISKALAALNGDAGEEWEVHCAFVGRETSWQVWSGDRLVVDDVDEATARRIASDHNRLPKLERAARDIVRDYDGDGVFERQVKALAAALEPKP